MAWTLNQDPTSSDQSPGSGGESEFLRAIRWWPPRNSKLFRGGQNDCKFGEFGRFEFGEVNLTVNSGIFPQNKLSMILLLKTRGISPNIHSSPKSILGYVPKFKVKLTSPKIFGFGEVKLTSPKGFPGFAHKISDSPPLPMRTLSLSHCTLHHRIDYTASYYSLELARAHATTD